MVLFACLSTVTKDQPQKGLGHRSIEATVPKTTITQVLPPSAPTRSHYIAHVTVFTLALELSANFTNSSVKHMNLKWIFTDISMTATALIPKQLWPYIYYCKLWHFKWFYISLLAMIINIKMQQICILILNCIYFVKLMKLECHNLLSSEMVQINTQHTFIFYSILVWPTIIYQSFPLGSNVFPWQ